VNQEWLGFTGSIIGGLITAGAGVAAWMAAQRTIDVTRSVAERTFSEGGNVRSLLARDPARWQRRAGN
jgi:hypothetical protein